jgi:hypothetical protein
VGVTRSPVSLSLSPSLLGRKMTSTQKEEEDVGETFESDGIASAEEVSAFVNVFVFAFLGKRSFFQSVSLSLFLFVRVYYIYLYSLSVLVCDRGVREDLVRNEIPPPKRRKRRETTEMSRTTTSTTRRVRVKTTKKSTRKRRNGIKS